MDNVKLLKKYSKSVLRDPDTVKLLAYLYVDVSLSEEEILGKFPGWSSSKMKVLLLELYKANLVKFTDNQWTTTEISEAILSEIGADITIIYSLIESLDFSQVFEQYFKFVIKEYYENDKITKENILGLLRTMIVLNPFVSKKASKNEAQEFYHKSLCSYLLDDKDFSRKIDTKWILDLEIDKFLDQSRLNKRFDKNTVKLIILDTCQGASEMTKISNLEILDNKWEFHHDSFEESKYFTMLRIYNSFINGKNDDVISIKFRNNSSTKNIKNFISNVIKSDPELANYFDLNQFKFTMKYLENPKDHTSDTIKTFSNLLTKIFSDSKKSKRLTRFQNTVLLFSNESENKKE